MIVHKIEQYSDEYWGLKLGKLSASKMKDVITSTGTLSGSRQKAIFKTLAELETGYYEETVKTKFMERGLALEDEALSTFTFITGLEVEKVGIVEAKHTPFICSPDALGKTFGVELKCPTAGVHLGYRHKAVLPTDYKPQVFTSLYICDEVEKWYFYSYHPDMKPFLYEVTRDNEEYKKYVDAIETHMPKIAQFIEEVKKGL